MRPTTKNTRGGGGLAAIPIVSPRNSRNLISRAPRGSSPAPRACLLATEPNRSSALAGVYRRDSRRAKCLGPGFLISMTTISDPGAAAAAAAAVPQEYFTRREDGPSIAAAAEAGNYGAYGCGGVREFGVSLFGCRVCAWARYFGFVGRDGGAGARAVSLISCVVVLLWCKIYLG